MEKLTKLQIEDVNNFLGKNELLDFINKYLTENNLSDFEVEYLKLKPKKDNATNKRRDSECGPGFMRVEVCTTSGKCEWQCIPIG